MSIAAELRLRAEPGQILVSNVVRWSAVSGANSYTPVGAVDISAEPEVSLWDIAPLKVIVEEAGGTFTDLEGNGVPGGGSIVCTNSTLHPEVLRRLAAR